MDASASALLEKAVSYLAPPIWYKDFDFWNVSIIAVTAIIVLVYVIETRKLRIEAQKTNKYSSRPVVVAKYITSEPIRKALTIMNIGKGPALNIESRICQILQGKKGYTNLRNIKVNEKFNNLRAGEKQALRRITTISQYVNAEGNEFSHGIRDKFAIIFLYEDVSKFKYQTVTLIEVAEKMPLIKKTISAEYNSGELENII